MSNVAIEAKGLAKTYRLYAKPHYRILDMFGLLRRGAGRYTEHPALRDFDITIHKGEKVAVIGRNGAGKSTFLKLVSSVIEPSEGSLFIQGEVHALLSIGSGFHPELSGRENVANYLGYRGIEGREADALIESIVEFAEIEEYVDQPMKAYSTGMGVRLMFAASTAITPDILVLDEVLSVGDAYFANKSLERMNQLTRGAGCTVLLVSHDVYSASNLCERTVWIDNGRIIMDGPSKDVVKAYEDSVRTQEEQRLRTRKLQTLKRMEEERDGVSDSFLLELRTEQKHPLSGGIYFSSLALEMDCESIASIPLAEEGEAAGSHVSLDASNWGPPETWQGRPSRPFLPYGSTFHKVCAIFRPEARLTRAQLLGCRINLDYWAENDATLYPFLFVRDQEYALPALECKAGQWRSQTLPVAGEADMAVECRSATVNTSGVYGSGAIAIENYRTLDEYGHEESRFHYGRPFIVELDYRIHQDTLRENAQIVVAFQKDGVHNVARVISRDLVFDGKDAPTGTIRMRFDELCLSDGEYSLTFLVAKEGYYESNPLIYFTLNPDVYYCLSRATEIRVRSGGLISQGTGVVLTAQWTRRTHPA